MPKNLWNDDDAKKLPALDGLVYRSNLLGSDRTVINIYGGNTSAKLKMQDHLGRARDVLWVKGSGSDVATITEQGFAGLYMDEILPLVERGEMNDQDMVDYLTRCTHTLNRPRQSIETLLHAFNPAPHVDHTHPDAIISLACAANGLELCKQLWGERMVWVDYIRPGFTLSKWIADGIRANKNAELVVMGKHGMVTWGDTNRGCYDHTIQILQEAEDFIERKRAGRKVFTITAPTISVEERKRILIQVLPTLRGAVSQQRPAILQVDTSEAAIEFASSADAATLSQVGAACPDHLVNTKRVPLFVEWKSSEGVEGLKKKLQDGAETFAAEYQKYFKELSSAGDKIFDPYPRVILIPGLGMINTGADAQLADVSNQLYHRAIQVMKGSQSLSDDVAKNNFVSLDAKESYGIEYWPLELYKLSLKPAPKELAGRVALITGAASGIGRAAALRLAQDGAHVAILDLNLEGAQQVAAEINKKFGFKRALALRCDVTDESAVCDSFSQVILEYGGVDIVVSNAGIAFSAPLEETTLANWQRVTDVLEKGYFLVSREAFKIWKAQKIGGNLIFVASKNSVTAGKNASVYSAAKANELHFARCLAEEGGAFGIRVNTVLPDAVLEGSTIWDNGWREARAAGYGIKPEDLDEYYRQRTTLKVNVHPDHLAEAISFFAGPRSSRTTGGVLTVDGGVAAAYAR